MNNTTLAVQHVSFGYDNHSAVLNDITFHAEAGESIGLVGANGVGKSTLLKLLVGLHLPTSGSIQLDDWAVEPKNLPQIREKIGYVFQDSDSQLFMSTAYEDIAFAPRNYGLSKKEVDARVNHALDAIDIQYLRDKQIYKMSGGEKKLVSIATILSMTPDVILMDEPSMGLSPIFVNEIFDIIQEVSKSGTTVLLVEQNIGKSWIGTAALSAKNNKIRRNFVNKRISLCYDKNIKRAL